VTTVARIAFFDEPPVLREDDDRRRSSLHELLRSLPGFVAGYELREPHSGRLCSLTLWQSHEALEAGQRAVRDRPVADQRGIRPSRIERWVVEERF
jgi:heme-degrading monooxygenase HmoA